MQRSLLIILSALLISFQANAGEYVMHESVKQVYGNYTCMRFAEADKILLAYKATDPDDPAIAYAENYALFLKCFISEDRALFNKLKSEFGKRMDIADDISDDSPWKRFFKAEMLMHVAVIKIKFREYITSAYQLRKAYKLLEENKRLFPDFVPDDKTLGFFHCAIATVPENYMWLVSIAGFNGSLSAGIQELDRALKASQTKSEYKWMYGDAVCLRLVCKMNFEKAYKEATKMAGDIDPTFHGPLRNFITASVYVNNNTHGDEYNFFQNTVLNPAGYYPIPYLRYMRGLVHLGRLELTDAEADFKYYSSVYKGHSFVKASLQKQAWIKLLQGDKPGYLKMIAKVDEVGDDFTDEDKQAQKEFENAIVPNPYLLKARVLFDGAQYLRSLYAIAGVPIENFSTTRDQVELTYRMGRINDELQRTPAALRFYIKTIEIGQKLPYYFAANSALHAAYIYEMGGDTTNAIKYYKQCLDMRGHDYQNSIDQKAKSGLQRINPKK